MKAASCKLAWCLEVFKEGTWRSRGCERNTFTAERGRDYFFVLWDWNNTYVSLASLPARPGGGAGKGHGRGARKGQGGRGREGARPRARVVGDVTALLATACCCSPGLVRQPLSHSPPLRIDASGRGSFNYMEPLAFSNLATDW
ncbi:hypothetical protein HaLaN_20476 [Haematococcus lacustris]|uniref:Uncharacterized protein n=1 Tax=Haematococcus lacustris TaxID=44745 RepID=A0A699ZJI7_HAELA|nr:hypothetical protein HaLaN_20476 [Haematococcus lacustris]